MQPESMQLESPPPASHVYVDARMLGDAGADRDPAGTGPGAHSALEHLRDAGYRVILVDAPHVHATRPSPEDPAQIIVAALPAGAEGWLVTGDAAVCTGARELRRLRTILVGPTVQGRGLAHRPADAEARDLLDAVLTILAAGAMPGDARSR